MNGIRVLKYLSFLFGLICLAYTVAFSTIGLVLSAYFKYSLPEWPQERFEKFLWVFQNKDSPLAFLMFGIEYWPSLAIAGTIAYVITLTMYASGLLHYIERKLPPPLGTKMKENEK